MSLAEGGVFCFAVWAPMMYKLLQFSPALKCCGNCSFDIIVWQPLCNSSCSSKIVYGCFIMKYDIISRCSQDQRKDKIGERQVRQTITTLLIG